MAPFERRLFANAGHPGILRLALGLTALVGVLGMHGLPGYVVSSAPESMTAGDHLVPAPPDQPLASLSPSTTTIDTAGKAIAAHLGAGGVMEHAACLFTRPRAYSPPSPTPVVLANASVAFSAGAAARERISRPRIHPGVDRVALCVSLS